jgi:quercetin dioxygenase-like cupin family protein
MIIKTGKISILLLILIATAYTSQAQVVANLPEKAPTKEAENVAVEQLATDSLCTSFMIWIKGGVKHHFHQNHTECIYIIEGSGEMTLADSTFTVNAGDFVQIPKGVVHAVTATKPMKVLSIQTPQWIVEDRKFISPIRRPHNE